MDGTRTIALVDKLLDDIEGKDREMARSFVNEALHTFAADAIRCLFKLKPKPGVTPMSTTDPVAEGKRVDELIAAEVAIQDRMWGDDNGRADADDGQLLGAALAQAAAIRLTQVTSFKRAVAFEQGAAQFYPRDWSGFRDYGSDVANLVVAAAFIRNEIKRLVLRGESTYRAPRPKTQVYTGDQPHMSSAEAGK